MNGKWEDVFVDDFVPVTYGDQYARVCEHCTHESEMSCLEYSMRAARRLTSFGYHLLRRCVCVVCVTGCTCIVDMIACAVYVL
jgi:hypothetical protein